MLQSWEAESKIRPTRTVPTGRHLVTHDAVMGRPPVTHNAVMGSRE